MNFFSMAEQLPSPLFADRALQHRSCRGKGGMPVRDGRLQIKPSIYSFRSPDIGFRNIGKLSASYFPNPESTSKALSLASVNNVIR